MATLKEQIDEFMTTNGYDAADLQEIESKYEALEQHLHESFSHVAGDNAHRSRPQVVAHKLGTFGLGIPARGEQLEILILGTISSDIYHDLIWERLQILPEFTKHEAGVYETQKLPHLGFLINFKGLDFQWTYRQESELVRSFGDDLSKAPRDFLDDFCADVTAEIVQAIPAQQRTRRNIATRPFGLDLYTCLYAWADLDGRPQGKSALTDAERVATQNTTELYPKSPNSFSVSVISKSSNSHDMLWEVWLQVLRAWKVMPLSKKMLMSNTKELETKFPSRFITFRVTHTGCSDSQASSWFRYIESRLDALNTRLLTETVNMKLWHSRLVHQAQNTADSGTYEGCYVFRVAFHSMIETRWELVPKLVDAELRIIERHESTLPGRCFINYEILSPEQLAKEEEMSGILVNCTKPIIRSFIPPPKPLILETVPTLISSRRIKSPVNNSASTEPKAKLRTASDIYSRLLHDAKYNADEYVVGYMDRFSNFPLEIGVNSWCRVQEDENFIPESRVVYFKRRWRQGDASEFSDHIVWDRAKKIDEVFWSGDSSKTSKS